MAHALTDAALVPETQPGMNVETGDIKHHLLPPALCSILKQLHIEFESERQHLLALRRQRQAEWDAGACPKYLPRDSEAVAGDWQVAEIPDDLRKRRVEITGPVNSSKMVINMLSRNAAGYRADTAMLDFEDSMNPNWQNVLDGIENVIGAARGDLRFTQPAGRNRPAKVYQLDPQDMAVVMVRVRGLHLDERHFLIRNESIAAGLFDLTACLYHTAKTLINAGKTPKFYVPKCEHYLEARWWNQLFVRVQELLGLPSGTLRATFLIETLPAAMQMEEILYEFREHAAGLNVGRWDKIFSDIKCLMQHKNRVMADRGWINMDRAWMDNYAKRLIQICHRRRAFAIGGMSAFTPGSSPELRERQTEKVMQDKSNEARLGHDGCWVSHPYFIGPALSAFEQDNQLDVLREHEDRYPDLLPQSIGPKTLDGLRKNIRVGIAYMRGWQQGLGCVAWDNMMEDLATLEISRTQVWQWLHHHVRLDDGEYVDRNLVRQIFMEEKLRILHELEQSGNCTPELADQFHHAAMVAEQVFTEKSYSAFLHEAIEIEQTQGVA